MLNNTASSYAEGGGIFVTNSDLEMVRCNVSGNSAEEEADEGGGIYIEGTAALSLTDTEVSHNSAGVGGGLYATGGVNVQLTNVRMTGNIATENSDSNDWIRGSSTMVQWFRHHFRPLHALFPALLYQPARAVHYALLCAHADRGLTGACNPMLCPILWASGPLQHRTVHLRHPV